MAEFYAPYTDLAEMVNSNQSVYAFLYASRDLQGVLRTTDTILQQLERRDEVQEHIPADTRRPPNVGLLSATVAQHSINIAWTSCVCKGYGSY